MNPSIKDSTEKPNEMVVDTELQLEDYVYRYN